MKTYRHMQDGPVKRIVERELRSLMNDVERLLDMQETGLEDRAWLDKDDVLNLFVVAMDERGIQPKGGK